MCRTIQHEAEYLLIQNFEYILNGDGKQAQNETFLKKRLCDDPSSTLMPLIISTVQ